MMPPSKNGDCPPSFAGCSFEFIGDLAMVLRTRDAIAGVQTGQDKLDTRRPHGRALARVDFKRLLPGLGNALEALGIISRREQVADLDLDALAEYFNDLGKTVLIDVF